MGSQSGGGAGPIAAIDRLSCVGLNCAASSTERTLGAGVGDAAREGCRWLTRNVRFRAIDKLRSRTGL